MASVANTRVAEIGKRVAVLQRHELAKPLLNHSAAVQSQQCGPGQVDLQNPPLVVPEEIRNRGEIEQVAIPLRRLLGRCLGPQEFFVLHLQFDLMHLQLVDDGTRISIGRRGSVIASRRSQALVSLAGNSAA